MILVLSLLPLVAMLVWYDLRRLEEGSFAALDVSPGTASGGCGLVQDRAGQDGEAELSRS